MYKNKMEKTPKVFANKFQTVKHKYPTNYSTNNYVIPKKQLNISKYAISRYVDLRALWNNFINNDIKNSTSVPLFQNAIKNRLLNYDNEISLFQ